ncbi:unnamed protein product [Adineta steineri]|nr:unnamed protein product [Adineta steineri]CAF0794777.1 unnamed protein product [Adineta steineri]
METSISSANVGHQLLQKIGWTPGNGLGLNQNGIKSPISINFHQRRQGLGYEKELNTTNESLSIHSSTIINS